MTQDEEARRKKVLEKALVDVVQQAFEFDFVVTISLESYAPFAMGRYMHKVEARAFRSYRKE